MELKNLLDKPASECTDEELEKQVHLLSKLKIAVDRSKSGKKRVSNVDRQVADLLKGLSPEKLAKLMSKLKEE